MSVRRRAHGRMPEEALVPWIVDHPARALRALAAYENIKGERLRELGATSVSALRREWREVQEPKAQHPKVETVVAVSVRTRPSARRHRGRTTPTRGG